MAERSIIINIIISLIDIPHWSGTALFVYVTVTLLERLRLRVIHQREKPFLHELSFSANILDR